MFETSCPQCQHQHALDEAQRGELIGCQKCGWRFVALPPSADPVQEVRALLTSLWPHLPKLKVCDQRFVRSWAQAFVRRGSDVPIGRFRLEHWRMTAYRYRHLLDQSNPHTLRQAA